MMEEWLLLKDGGICRCCALEGPSKDLVSKYSWMGDDEIYSDMLRECFNITLVTVEEGSNGGICEVCITQLRSAYKFRQHVLHTEEQFKKKLESKNLCDSAFVKLEIPPETSDTDMDPMGDNDDNSDYEVPLKKIKDELESEMELMKQKKTPAKTIASKSTRTLKKKASVEPETSKSTGRKVYGEKSESRKLFINLMNILQYSNASLIRCKDILGFSCLFCPEYYSDPVDLKRHFINAHSNKNGLKNLCPKMVEYLAKVDITYLNCSLCDSDVATIEELIVHLKDDHGQEMYPEAKSNILPFKFETPGLYCAVCNAEFSNFKMMIEHMHTHYRHFICDICNAGFVTKHACAAHKNRHAQGAFHCKHCKNIFDTKTKLLEHVRRTHQGVKRLYCKVCLQRFSDQFKKVHHMTTVHGVKLDTFKCGACDKTFNDSKKMNVHVRKYHLMERNHACTHCDKRFFNVMMLKDHLICHGVGVESFVCEICFKVYTRKKSLRVHMKSHIKNESHPVSCKK